jgi:hypothetical protein
VPNTYDITTLSCFQKCKVGLTFGDSSMVLISFSENGRIILTMSQFVKTKHFIIINMSSRKKYLSK